MHVRTSQGKLKAIQNFKIRKKDIFFENVKNFKNLTIFRELDQIPLAKDLAKRCKHHELYLRILTENKVDASATQDQNEQFRSKECLTALNYIKNVEKKTDRSKFLRQFGNALVRYHPEKVLELLFDIIKEDYLDKKPQKEEEEKVRKNWKVKKRLIFLAKVPS